MASIPGTILAAKISPGDTAATFPTHEDIYGKGGLMSVSTIQELASIPLDRQKKGMLMYVDSNSQYYTLTSISFPLTSYSLFSNSLRGVNLDTVIDYLSTNSVSISSLSIIDSLTAKEIYGAGTETIVSDRDNVQGNGSNTLTLDFLNGVFVRNSLTVVGPVIGSNLNISNWNSVYTDVQSNSANWNFGYNVGTYVQANSASWEESAEIIPTVTNYLSTNNVLISSLNVAENITVSGTLSAQSYAGPIVLSNTNTSIIVQPEDNLAAKYNQAKLLTPNGSALSTTNRASLIIMPGNYTLAAELAINAQFVDVIGLGAQKLERGAIPAVVITGNTLNVTANNVRISGISVGSQNFKTGSNLPLQRFENCTGGDFSFGGSNIIVSGTFTNCIGGDDSFGGFDGIASGTFANCIGGAFSFGSGGSGAASGIFTNCTGGSDSFGSFGGVASGTFTNCIGGGDCFGASGTASGIFTNCIGGSFSFGGFGTASGKFYQCRLTAGAFRAVTGGGLMRNCIDGNNNIVDQ